MLYHVTKSTMKYYISYIYDLMLRPKEWIWRQEWMEHGENCDHAQKNRLYLAYHFFFFFLIGSGWKLSERVPGWPFFLSPSSEYWELLSLCLSFSSLQRDKEVWWPQRDQVFRTCCGGHSLWLLCFWLIWAIGNTEKLILESTTLTMLKFSNSLYR